MRFTGTHILMLGVLGFVAFAIYKQKIGVSVSAGASSTMTPSAPSQSSGTDPIQGVGAAVGGVLSQLNSLFGNVVAIRQTAAKNT